VFEPASRYASVEQATLTTTDGRTVAFVRRRFLPQGRTLPVLARVTVADGDRLDVITFRALGDPEHFWRMCDANDAMNPLELTDPAGRVLRVPVPGM
jgi:hypothetical protein